LLLLSGCGEPAQITEYTIPKSSDAKKSDSPPESTVAERPVIPAHQVPADWVEVTAEQPGLPSYKLPPDWEQAPDARLSAATYKVSKDGQETLLTMTALVPLTEAMIPANVSRWRGQAQLPPVKPAETLDSVSTLMVDGAKARYIRIAPDEVKPGAKAMLVACIDHAGQTWYFKLFGDAPITLEQEVRFQTFAQTVRFSPEQETGDE
jgi:hypothetical protein